MTDISIRAVAYESHVLLTILTETELHYQVKTCGNM